MKLLNIISRLIIGVVFIFSGIVKAIDPLGSAYKFHDYFHAFNIGFLDLLSLPLAILLCTAEFLAGFSVLTGIKIRTGRLVVLILLSVFTPITFILALTNPVSDCGCFGDAIHLSNWQTFGKNIVLSMLLIALYKSDIVRKFSKKVEWIIIACMALACVAFSLVNLRYLPVIDFLPYKIGTKIADKMTIPDGMATDQFKTTFVYEKNGVHKEFNLNNYPANDSTWKFIDQKSVLMKKGYVPPIHDFQITTLDGEDITQKILNNKGYSLLMISKKLNTAKPGALSDGFKLGKFCETKSITFYIITSSGTTEVKTFEEGLPFCSADETTLKTMVRANPGFILLKDGVIEGKWSPANVPEEKWFENLIN